MFYISSELCQIELNRLGSFELPGDSELLKSFRSNIQDGHHGGHLENFQMKYLLPNIKLD